MAGIVAEDPELSIRRRFHMLVLSYDSPWHILHMDLHLQHHKMQLSQELKLSVFFYEI